MRSGNWTWTKSPYNRRKKRDSRTESQTRVSRLKSVNVSVTPYGIDKEILRLIGEIQKMKLNS